MDISWLNGILVFMLTRCSHSWERWVPKGVQRFDIWILLLRIFYMFTFEWKRASVYPPSFKERRGMRVNLKCLNKSERLYFTLSQHDAKCIQIRGITLPIVTYTKLQPLRRRCTLGASPGGIKATHGERSGNDKMQARVAVLKICARIADRAI